MLNSVDPEQLASLREASCSGSTLLKLAYIWVQQEKFLDFYSLIDSTDQNILGNNLYLFLCI